MHQKNTFTIVVSILLLSVLFYSPAKSITDNHDTRPGTHSSSIVSFAPVDGYFPLSVDARPVPLFIDKDDYPGVVRTMVDLRTDIERVTNTEPNLSTTTLPESDKIILAGTIGRSSIIEQLIESGKLDVSGVRGKWETFILRVIDNPFDGIEKALVIAGSDKRGTIYGIYELSKQIGVSPWYYWADVPVRHQPDIYIAPDPLTLGEPKVQYRGIFINNENPALLGWVNHTFGGFNHNFYEKVFELILRLRGNYLWPAMWGKAFHDDDQKNAEMADLYGVVIGYTHHEPMMRAHVEWSRSGGGPWDYQTNDEFLRGFWREGIERMGTFESTVTLGMRGDGDYPMSDEANIELLERIVNDQRRILEESAQDVDNVLQLWALYKEVQEYYEKGMQVPDDVMILLANDNWGNVRLLPDPDEARQRKGGWGMYYHFDYVGGPRSYKWINTVQISRIWEQMHLTYRHGVDRMWLVNVGDIKPMEFPISFFLDFAWNPDSMPVGKIADYPRWWAKQQFGNEYADEIGYLLTEYTRYNSRRKPELLNQDTYSIFHYREAERIVEEYNELATHAERINELLPEKYRDAFYQLVLYPVKASANLNELYLAAAKNRLYREQGRVSTNTMADKVRRHFDLNTEFDEHYHHKIADGKWLHMMSQTRIGYSSWREPPKNIMPPVAIISPAEPPDMGIFVEGSQGWWRANSDYPVTFYAHYIENYFERPGETRDPILPQFDTFNRQSFFIELFNRGRTPFDYRVKPDAGWVKVSEPEGTIDDQKRVWISIDWDQVPDGTHRIPITIESSTIDATGRVGNAGSPITVYAEIFNPSSLSENDVTGYVEGNGYVSIEAPNYSRNIQAGDIAWTYIPQLGRTYAAMMPLPVRAESRTPDDDSTPRLEYDMHLFTTGEVKVHVYLSPTKNYTHTKGLRYGISFDDEEPQIVNMHEEMIDGFNTQAWERWVSNNINIRKTTHTIAEPGRHVLKLWMVDPGVVVQKIVVETDEIGNTYLGPPASFRNSNGDTHANQ
jgi:hypothetical protein